MANETTVVVQKSLSDRLEEARQQLELEVTESQLRQLRGAQQLSDAQNLQNLQEANSHLADPQGYLYDDDRFHRRDPRIFGGYCSQLDDRLRGKNYPVFEDEMQLAEIRGDGRILSEKNPIGLGIRRNLTNFTLGTGFTYKFSPKDEDDQDLTQAAQDWLDEFDERVEWTMVEREMHERTIPDGEVFLRLDPISGGRAETVFPEPDAITEPTQSAAIDDFLGFFALDWKFGIASLPRRPDRPVAYFQDMTGDQTDWDVFPADRMVHGKRNVVANVKRGTSDYYPVAADLRRVDKIFRNTGEGAALQSAIAFIREHAPGVTESQVSALTGGKEELEIDRITAAGNQRTERFQRYLPGTILDVKNGQVYKPGPMGDGAKYVDVSAALLDYAGTRWNFPSYMLSSNAEGTSFATGLVMESPFVKAMEWEQTWFVDLYKRVKWKMLGIAIRAGRFARFGVATLDQMRQRLTLNVQTPRVSVRNRLEDTKIHSVLHQAEILSKQTWASIENLDFDHEKSNLEKEPPAMVAGNPLQSAELSLQTSDRQFQPQADEPGNTGAMPETRQR
jgi:hypothetical protein